MTQIDFTIDQNDLKILFLHTRHAYSSITFEKWVIEVKSAYSSFIREKENPKTFSAWVNGQIIALT